MSALHTEFVNYDQTTFLLTQLGEGKTVKSDRYSITTYPTLKTMHGDFILKKIQTPTVYSLIGYVYKSEYYFTATAPVSNFHSKGFYQIFIPHEEIGKLDRLARKYLAPCIWIQL
jgi:hypothetical protein